jgi:hypothetical protein
VDGEPACDTEAISFIIGSFRYSVRAVVAVPSWNLIPTFSACAFHVFGCQLRRDKIVIVAISVIFPNRVSALRFEKYPPPRPPI